MNKQPLKALALIGALISGLTATAVQAAEVNDVLKAGASKVQSAKTSQTKVESQIKLMGFCKNSNRSTSKSNRCVYTTLSWIARLLAKTK